MTTQLSQSRTVVPAYANDVLVRPLGTAGDRNRLRELCPRVSAQSGYQRFQGVVKELTDVFLDRLMDVDHDRREALVALDADEIVAVARYAVSPEQPEQAEVAILVADDWQGRGVARRLLTDLRDIALQHDVRSFTATVLAGNAQAQGLLSALAPGLRAIPDGDHLVYELDLLANDLSGISATRKVRQGDGWRR